MSEHYFTASPAGPAEEREHSFVIRGTRHTVTTASGVFSADRLDKGTQVLLDRVPDPPESGLLLDLGCGWGPIALALADAAPGATVLAADVNERAVDLAARNAAAAGHANIHAAEATALAAELKGSGAYVDLIWSNPPVRIGKPALHALLDSWIERLADDGAAYLVVQRNLGADSLHRWMAERGWGCERVASSKGYRVLSVRRRG